MELVKAFNAARRVSTPIVVVRTPDAASTIRILSSNLVGSKEDVAKVPVFYWDIMRGMIGASKAGKATIQSMTGKSGSELQMITMKPTDSLEIAEKMPQDSILFMNFTQVNMRGQRFWDDEVVAQGVWNLRDVFKMRGCTLVILVTSGAIVPVGLRSDVLVLDEPLPSEGELEKIVEQTYSDARLDPPNAEAKEKAVAALIGLSSFTAEQTLAQNLTKSGLDYKNLWEQKRLQVEQTRGLSIWREGETFADIGGVDNAKKFFTRVINGKEAPELVVFIDEIEKQFAGSGTDLSGVKTGMTGKLLTWMQDHNATGAIFIGPPGASKSMLAKAIGNEAGIPTVAMDFDGMQSSLVGTSGENLASALKVIEAISRNRVLFIATCNSIGALPPELRRRFTLGTFFFDLPTTEEREVIWDLYLKKFSLKGKDLPNDEGWTGAEIRNCCQSAYRLGWGLKEAASYIVPVAQSAAKQIKELRMQASGKYISASEEGVYDYQEGQESSKKGGPSRLIRVDPTQVGQA